MHQKFNQIKCCNLIGRSNNCGSFTSTACVTDQTRRTMRAPGLATPDYPPAAIKDDKAAFQSQEMYMEAVAPLAALLEQTNDENFTISEAIPMVQSAIQLLGDATQHQSAMRRKAIMQHLNPKLQTLMKDVDFKGTQPLLFGEDFGEKAKAKMEAAAALQKIVTPPRSKGKQMGFQKGHPQKNT